MLRHRLMGKQAALLFFLIPLFHAPFFLQSSPVIPRAWPALSSMRRPIRLTGKERPSSYTLSESIITTTYIPVAAQTLD
jgi:hypothetical protein